MGSYKEPGKTVVLVVDDEPLLRMMAVDLVEDAGFEAIEAKNADEAIVILDERRDIRILFTDIDMPGTMNGMMLAAAVRDCRSDVEIIIVSGQVRPEHNDLPARSMFFSKPYDAGSVTRHLQRMVKN